VGGSPRNHGWPGGPAGIRLVTQGSYGDSRNSWSRRSSRDRRSFHFYARITQATSRASFRWQLLGGVLATVLTVVCVLGAAAPAQAGWNAPVSISARGNIGPVRLAVNARGDAIAVWARVTRPVNLRRLQQGYAVEAAFRPAQGTWEPPVIVGNAVQPCPRETCGWPVPSVGIGARGGALVVWAGFTTSGAGVIRAASRTAGGGWQRPIVLDRLYGGEPQVALDQRGNATAIWAACSAGCAIRVAFKPAGRPWRKPATIGSGLGAALALDAKGDAIAVWTNLLGNRAGYLVQSAFRPARGSWRRPVTIGRGGESYAPRVAADARGDTIAVWANAARPGECCPTTVQAAFRPAGGVWRHAVTLQHNKGGTGDVQLALGTLGTATAVWVANGPGATVQVASRPAGGSWGAPIPIATSTGAIDSLGLGVDMRGNALATWWVVEGDVQAAIGSPEGLWQPPISLGGGAPPQFQGAIGVADVAVDSQGNAVFVWISDLGAGKSVVRAASFSRRGRSGEPASG